MHGKVKQMEKVADYAVWNVFLNKLYDIIIVSFGPCETFIT